MSTIISLSSVQKEIWFNQMLYPHLPMYNIGGYVCINNNLSVPLLEQAISFVVQNNDAFRIVLRKDAELPVQEIMQSTCPVIKFYDCSKEKEPHSYIKTQIQDELLIPFQLYDNPLYKFIIFKASEKKHYVLQKSHHIIVDGWGIALAAKQIIEAYNVYLKGHIPQATAFSYLDYIHVDQTYLVSEKFKKDQEYWLNKYSYLPIPLFTHKILEKQYQTQQNYCKPKFSEIPTSDRTTLQINRKWYDQLTQFAATYQSSITHLILGVLYCYFVRITQKEDFCIGIALLNRNTAAFKQTVGLFASVIPAWFKFGTELTFIELLTAISQELRRDYRHQRFPLSEINRMVGLHKQKRTQLFDVTLSSLKEQYDISTIELSNRFKQNPLEIFINQFYDTEHVSIHFDYNLAFIDEQEIEQIKTRFAFLLQEVITHPTTPLWKLEIIPPTEKQRILYYFNNTAVDYPLDKTVIDLFEEQVEKNPTAIALHFGDKEVNYQELNNRANQLAHYLQKLGILPEAVVGICLERSIEMIVSLLGILKAGGTYVPLDPTYPQERLVFMLYDSKAFALLTESKLKTLFKSVNLLTLYIDEKIEIISQEGQNNPRKTSFPQNLVYIIYTSGSTGKPKGVEITHYSLSNFLYAMASQLCIMPQDSVLSLTTISFDMSKLEIYLPLIIGAKIVLIDQETTTDRDKLIKTIEYYRITIIQATPATWRLIVADNKWKIDFNAKLLSGGEVLSSELSQQLLKGGNTLWNGYGPTEATVFSTIYKINPRQLDDNKNNSCESIGYPIDNTKIYILDKRLQLMPINTIGEIYIGGVGLARGYLNRPELTAEKFIPHPFSNEPGDRIYKTGDLARYLPNGTIEYLGRIDTQVKIRGFRIELGEIEATLKKYSHVQDAVVIVTDDFTANKQLIAYYVASKEFSANELRNFLKKTLPHYMLPSIFMRIPHFPTTPSGKVDRQALPKPDRTKHVEGENFVAPRNNTERVVAEIWSRVLGVEHVSIYDNFFELGGHSLSATHVLIAIQEAFNIELPIRYLFEEATIADLSRQIEIRRWAHLLPKSTHTHIHSSIKNESKQNMQKEDRESGKI